MQNFKYRHITCNITIASCFVKRYHGPRLSVAKPIGLVASYYPREVGQMKPYDDASHSSPLYTFGIYRCHSLQFYHTQVCDVSTLDLPSTGTTWNKRLSDNAIECVKVIRLITNILQSNNSRFEHPYQTFEILLICSRNSHVFSMYIG